MRARVNTFALRQTTVESAKLAVLGTLAHPITDEGSYLGSVYQGAAQVATFHLTVSEDSRSTQADVDLASLLPHRRHERTRPKEPRYSVAPKGYLVLYVSEGSGGFAVRLDKLGKAKPQRIFDSRSLRSGDIFVASLLRPGLYEATDRLGKGRARISVGYPEVGKKPYRPAAPEEIVVTQKGFLPSALCIGAASSVVFTLKRDKSALAVTLKKPDDGPRKPNEKTSFRWTNPSPPKR